MIEPRTRTKYAYDVLDNLICVAQKGNTTGTFTNCASTPVSWRPRSFTYNSLSQLTTTANPESGTVNYTYDSNGNVLTKVAPAPNQTGSATVTTTYVYDALNRLTSKSYSDNTPLATYSYDQQAPWGWNLSNYIGRMTTAGTGGTTPTANLFNYDPMGRVSMREQCQPTNCAAAPSLYAQYTYNLAGSPTSLQFGVGGAWSRTISYAYDAATRTTTVTSNLVDSQHPATLYSVDPSIGYFPNGAVRKARLANGLTETSMYNSRLQPCRLETNSTGASFSQCTDGVLAGNVLDFTFGYNLGSTNNGNLTSWASVGNQIFARSYGYDSLNRISTMSDTASAQPCKGLSWTVDPWGNLTDQSVTSGSCLTLHVSAGTNNRLNAPYQYDAAGNMTYDGTHTYTYDSENRITKVDNGSTATYVYDAEGHRVLDTNVSTNTRSFIYGTDGEVVADVSGTGAELTDYIYFNGALVAQYRDSTTYSIVRDHLGSARLITKLDKSPYDSLDFLPFGAQTAGDTGTTHKFTGKERDSESGLDNMGARFYASSAGRFLSPDSVLGDANLTDPQTFNLYMYSRNNPLLFVDPSGNEIKYAPNLRNAEAVRDVVNAILANPATSGTLSGYVGPNNPDLTIQSGNLSAGDTRTVNADGSITTTQTLGETEPDIQTTKWSTGSETQLNSATITVDNRVTENGVPGVMSHEAEHAGEARSDPAKFVVDANAEKALKHDLRPQEQRANDFQHQHEQDIARAAKQAKADREKKKKDAEKKQKEEEKARKHGKKKKKEADR